MNLDNINKIEKNKINKGVKFFPLDSINNKIVNFYLFKSGRNSPVSPRTFF